jgi:hypothetical protein
METGLAKIVGSPSNDGAPSRRQTTVFGDHR